MAHDPVPDRASARPSSSGRNQLRRYCRSPARLREVLTLENARSRSPRVRACGGHAAEGRLTPLTRSCSRVGDKVWAMAAHGRMLARPRCFEHPDWRWAWAVPTREIANEGLFAVALVDESSSGERGLARLVGMEVNGHPKLLRRRHDARMHSYRRCSRPPKLKRESAKSRFTRARFSHLWHCGPVPRRPCRRLRLPGLPLWQVKGT
jgi:hypothetical protein